MNPFQCFDIISQLEVKAVKPCMNVSNITIFLCRVIYQPSNIRETRMRLPFPMTF